MKIVIVGTGYVGLVSAACFAQLGVEVCCVDSDGSKVSRLQAGEIPIFEPGLTEMLAAQRELGRIAFSTVLPALDRSIDAVMIAVGTPPLPNGRGADLSSVLAVAADIAAAADQSKLVVIVKSTVPVGTGDLIESRIRRNRPDIEVAVVSNPEFMRQGEAVGDFLRPDRIVVGMEDDSARDLMARLYAPLTDAGAVLLFIGRRASEMVKSASNAFLAAKIAFINEVSDLCEAADADVREVAEGIGLDRRIGPACLDVGPGFGGSCFPKDCADIIANASQRDVRLRVVEGALAANTARKLQMARKIIEAFDGNVCGRTIAVIGLTFKAGTDDMREAPSIAIVEALTAAGAQVRAYDPQGMAQARRVLPQAVYFDSPYEAAKNADAVVLATFWQEFRALDAGRLARNMRRKLFIDLRNAADAAALQRAGFTVLAVGRRWTKPQVGPDAEAVVGYPRQLTGASPEGPPRLAGIGT